MKLFLWILIHVVLACGLTAAEKYVPAAARVPGLAGTFFRTDVRIVNLSSDANAVEVSWLPSGVANPTPPQTVTLSLDPRSSHEILDVLSTLFTLESGTGALRISAPGDFSAASRIWTSSPSCDGSFGQFVPAEPVSAAVTAGVLSFAHAGFPSGSGFRTNIGAMNPGPAAARVTLDLRAATGSLLGSATLDVPPFSQTQASLAALFPSATATTSNAFVETSSPAPVFAYLSLVDNVSGDSVYVLAEADPGTRRPANLIVAKQWTFEPATIEVEAGKRVTFLVRSLDVNHGIAFSGVGAVTCSSQTLGPCILEPGEDVTISFTPTTKGTFAFFCTIFCHDSQDGNEGHATMRGAVIVK